MTEPIRCPDCQSVVPELAEFCPGCKKPRTHVAEYLQQQSLATGTPYETLLVQAQARGSVQQPAQVVSLPIRYLPAQEQTPWIHEVVNRVMPLLTDDEEMLYIATQDPKALKVKKDAVVATTNRIIIFRPKTIGGYAFVDLHWQDIRDIHLKQGTLLATLTIQTIQQRWETVDSMTRDTAQRLYSIAQQYEREWRERRRIRMMEEDRAKAGGVTVNVPTQQPFPVPVPIPAGEYMNGGGHSPAAISAPVQANDPVERLAKAKAMLDQGLIGSDEYDALKTRILSEI